MSYQREPRIDREVSAIHDAPNHTTLPTTTPIHIINRYQQPTRNVQTPLPPPLPPEPQPPQDNNAYGDPIEIKDLELNTYRHTGGNVNGISSAQRFHAATALSMMAVAHKADGASYIETNVDYNYQGAKHQIRNKLKKAWNNVIAMTSSNSCKTFSTYYQPGGVSQVIGGPWARRVTVNESDPTGLGQWTYQTISGIKGKNLSIITAYQVCKGNTQLGERTTFKQRQAQLSTMYPENTSPPDPRKHFAHDLLQIIRNLQDKQHGILLVIDANSYLDDQFSWLHPFLRSSSLTDIYEYRHGYETKFETYQRGSHRIDFMFASQEVLPFVTGCGYTTYTSTSDHRTMFCDISLAAYLQDKPPPDNTIGTPRYILSKYKKMRNQYKESVLRTLTQNLYMATLQDISDAASTTETLSDEVKVKLESLDDLITKTMVDTETIMKRKHNTPWSPILVQATNEIMYWQAWIKELKTGRDLSQRRSQHLPADFPHTHSPTPPTLQTAHRQHRQSVKHLEDISKQAKQIRENWLLEQEGISIAEGHPSRARYLRNIRRSEETSASFDKIRNAIQGTTAGALKALLIPDSENNTHKRITDPTEIVEQLILRNVKHFNQADGTTFTQKHLQEICSQTFTAAIIQLQLIDNESDAFQAVVTELAKTYTDPDEEAGFLSPHDFIAKLRRWKERTTTSPSNRHLGLYKAIQKGDNPQLTQDTGLTNPYDSIQLESQPEQDHGEDFFKCITTIINICVKSGYVLQRWKKINNVMLEKIPGIPLLDKLRVIHIFEADINAWAGIVFGRRMMQKAEFLNALGNEQGGSRKGKSSIDVYAMKFFSFQISEVTRTPLAVMDNDAKACYDRIVLAPVYLRCQQLGIPFNACRLLDNYLSQAEYHIQTQLGTSEQYYQSTPTHKLHGPGQGSQCSPAIWTVISTILLSAVRKKSPGTFFTDPNQTTTVSHYMQSFVDDSSIWINDFLPSLTGTTDVQSLIDQLQIATQWWEKLLVTSGGKLELPKCFFYAIEWNFITSPPRPYTTTERQYELCITQSTDSTIEKIHQKSSDQHHRTLGFQAQPSNNFTAQAATLLDKSRSVTRAIRSFNLDPASALRAYHAVFIPRMKYPLHLCGISKQKLHQIQSAPLNATLQSLGFPRSFPRALVFGNPVEGGLGYTHLYTEQGIINTTFLLRHLRHQKQIGDIVIISLQWFQHYAGVPFPLLELPHLPITRIPSTWLTELRTFLESVQGQLHLPKLQIKPIYRVADFFMMVQVHNYDFSEHEIHQINQVRLYLQVTRMSEICNVQGTQLTFPAMSNPTPDGFPSISTELWPVQPRPTAAHWIPWNKYMQLLTKDGTILRSKLREWIPQRYDRTWPVMFAIDTDSILKLSGPRWQVFQIVTRSRHGITCTVHPSESDDTLAPNSVPVGILHRDNYYSEPTYTNQGKTPSRAILTFHDFTKTLSTWEADLLSHNRQLDDHESLILILTQLNRIVYIVSDGGHRHTNGSFGWVIATEEHLLWEGWGMAHGGPMSSYRAEAYGRLAAIRFLMRYSEFMGVPLHHSIIIQSYTDNKELLRQEAKWRHSKISNPYHYLSPDIDAITMLVNSWKSAACPATHTHVKGHQDDHTPVHLLPWPAQLNIHADALATHALDTLPHKQKMRPALPCQAHLLLSHQVITSKYPAALKAQASRGITRQYLATKGIPSLIFDAIHWTSLKTARNTLPIKIQTFSHKMLSNWVPTNAIRAKRESAATSGCPHCDCPLETFDHVLQCPSQDQWRQSFHHDLEHWLDQHETPSELSQHIAHTITTWLHAQPNSNLHLVPTEFVIRGCIPSSWVHMIHQTSDPSSFTRSGSTWATQLSMFLTLRTHQAWILRCSRATIQSENAASAQTRIILRQHITDLYNIREQCYLQYPFEVPLDHRLSLPTHLLSAWLTNHSQNIKDSHATWKNRNKLRQTDLRSLIPRTERIPPRPALPQPMIDTTATTSPALRTYTQQDIRMHFRNPNGNHPTRTNIPRRRIVTPPSAPQPPSTNPVPPGVQIIEGNSVS